MGGAELVAVAMDLEVSAHRGPRGLGGDMVGSGVPALSLFLLMQGSVGEGPRREGQRAEQGPPRPPHSS